MFLEREEQERKSTLIFDGPLEVSTEFEFM